MAGEKIDQIDEHSKRLKLPLVQHSILNEYLDNDLNKFFDEDNKPHKLDMGIIYSDVIEVRDGTAKFISRDFSLKWQKTDVLDILEKK